MALFLRKGQVDNMNQTYMKEQKILPLLLKMSASNGNINDG